MLRLATTLTFQPPPTTTIHLYLHIPFCHRICPYCSFYKHTPGRTDFGRFVEALCCEAARRAADLASPRLDTIYFGGGTPSMLSPAHLRRLFAGLREVFPLAGAAEVTLEANPATFTERTAALYRELGVTRVSLGAQSFHPAHLATLGREHRPDDIATSVRRLVEAGLSEINIDLMFSVPGQTVDDWRSSLEAALALEPHHISAYNLTYEEDTPFFDQLAAGRYHDNPQRNEQMFTLAHDVLTAAGFHHYETSNYALPGHESRHNRAYWQGADYLGLGPSAVSTIAARRWKNIPDTERYLAMIAQVSHAESEVETLTAAQLRLERIALLLRTSDGVPWEHLRDVEPPRIDRLLDEGLAVRRDDALVLTGRGPLLVDSVVEHLVT